MKKVILIFVMILLVIAGMVTYYFYGGMKLNVNELLMGVGLVFVLGFAAILGVRRIRSFRRSEPLEDELSKRVMKRAAATAYYISLYTWLAMMFFSDKVKMDISSFIGVGIMIMALIFALSWVYHNFFSKINE